MSLQGGAVTDYTEEFMKLGEAEKVLAFKEVSQRLAELEQNARLNEQLTREQQWITTPLQYTVGLIVLSVPLLAYHALNVIKSKHV
jgi:hypothetical protein